MKYVYFSGTLTESTVAAMASLGFNGIVASVGVRDLDLLYRYNMQCLASLHDNKGDHAAALLVLGSIMTHPAVAGFILYDEPDVNGISIAAQDAFIASVRKYTRKPLAVCLIEGLKRKVSSNFDIYMPDIYWNKELTIKGRFKKLYNYLNIYMSSLILPLMYPGKTWAPVLGYYDDKGPFERCMEQKMFNMNWLRFFGVTNYAAYTWNSSEKYQFNGISTTPIYQMWVQDLNNRLELAVKPNLFYRAHRLLFKGICWCVVKCTA